MAKPPAQDTAALALMRQIRTAKHLRAEFPQQWSDADDAGLSALLDEYLDAVIRDQART